MVGKIAFHQRIGVVDNANGDGLTGIGGAGGTGAGGRGAGGRGGGDPGRYPGGHRPGGNGRRAGDPQGDDQGGLRRDALFRRPDGGGRFRPSGHGPHPGEGLLLLRQRPVDLPGGQVRQELPLHRGGQRGGAGAPEPGRPAPGGHHPAGQRLLPAGRPGGGAAQRDDRRPQAGREGGGAHHQPGPQRRAEPRRSGGDRQVRHEAHRRRPP